MVVVVVAVVGTTATVSPLGTATQGPSSRDSVEQGLYPVVVVVMVNLCHPFGGTAMLLVDVVVNDVVPTNGVVTVDVVAGTVVVVVVTPVAVVVVVKPAIVTEVVPRAFII